MGSGTRGLVYPKKKARANASLLVSHLPFHVPKGKPDAAVLSLGKCVANPLRKLMVAKQPTASDSQTAVGWRLVANRRCTRCKGGGGGSHLKKRKTSPLTKRTPRKTTRGSCGIQQSYVVASPDDVPTL